MPILTRWIAELQCDLADQRHTNHLLETRVHRLEQHIRRQALARRHWVTNGHQRELV